MSKELLTVQGVQIKLDKDEYICLTDMARAHSEKLPPDIVIGNWLRNQSTLEFLSAWEMIYNAIFKPIHLDGFKDRRQVSVTEWVEKTHAKGIYTLKGKHGGTYAHKDIAFEFGAAISVSFRLYLIKEFQRLKELEANQDNIEWNVRRFLCKEHYHILTDAVKKYKVPFTKFPPDKLFIEYAEEGDILNLAVWGFTAKKWRTTYPLLASKGENMRNYASVNELAVISVLSGIDAEMIKQGVSYNIRLENLKRMAKEHLQVLDIKNPSHSLKKALDGSFQPLYQEQGKPLGMFPQKPLQIDKAA